MKEAHQIIKRPLITEKSHRQKEEGNQIAFVVDPRRENPDPPGRGEALQGQSPVRPHHERGGEKETLGEVSRT